MKRKFNQKKIAENLRLAAVKKDFNYAQIAKEIGVTHASVSYYMSGERSPSLKHFFALCALLEIPPGEVLAGK